MIIEIIEVPKFKVGDIVIELKTINENEIPFYKIVTGCFGGSFTCYSIFHNSFYGIKQEHYENKYFEKLDKCNYVTLSGHINFILADYDKNNFLCKTACGGSIILETEYNKNNKLIVKKLKPFENPNDITLSRVRFYGDLILRNSED